MGSTRPTGTAAVTPAGAGLEGHAFWLFLFNVIALAVGYATSVIIARYLGAEARGLLAVMFVIAVIVVAVVGLGFPVAATYYGSRRPRLRPALLGNGLLATAGITAVTLVLAAALAGVLTRRFSEGYDERLWLLTGALAPLLFLEYLVTSLLASQSDFRRIRWLRLNGRIAGLAAAAVFLIALDWTLAGALLVYAATSVFSFVGGLRPLLDEGLRLSGRVAAASIRYGARVQVGRLFELLNARFDVLVLSLLAPLETVGVYAIAQLVAELVILVPRSFGAVLMPTVAGQRGTDRISGSIVRLNGSLSLIALVGVGVVGPFLILFGYGDEFRAGLVPFFILLPGLWFLSGGTLVSSALRGRGRPGTSSLLAAAEVVLTIGLDLLLIPPFGATGAAVASTCAYTAYGLASLWVLARQDGTSLRSLLLTTATETSAYTALLRRKLGLGALS